MISFYPGPSRVYDEIPEYVADAFKEGILSVNHRSEAFTQLSKRTISLLQEKLNIPTDYTVFFTSSATECWEIIAQSIIKEKSYHIYNGAFGQKWFDYTQRLQPVEGMVFDVEEKLNPSAIQHISADGLICLTQNETSNGTQVTNSILRSIRKNIPDPIIAVDVTSSLAGIRLDLKSADIWFGSVQKCFGLPAGLGLLICSPRALQRTSDLAEKAHYNSLTFMVEMMRKWQTSYTPNVMGIYLLMRILEATDPIKEVHKKIFSRYHAWVEFLSERKSIKHLVHNKAVHSFTVIPVTASPEIIMKIKSAALDKNILLGEGYGSWKTSTFRIANFPALRKKEIKKLMTLLEKF